MSDNLYTMSINFDKVKHKDILKWVKEFCTREERSYSWICIAALKAYQKQLEDGKEEEE